AVDRWCDGVVNAPRMMGDKANGAHTRTQRAPAHALAYECSIASVVCGEKIGVIPGDGGMTCDTGVSCVSSCFMSSASRSRLNSCQYCSYVFAIAGSLMMWPTLSWP